MDFRQLHSFVAVAEHGGLTRAAIALGTAKQPLSIQMQQLEQELGVSLFRRHGRGMVLTRHGHAFLAHARDLLQRHDAFLGQLRHDGLARDVVRVGLIGMPPVDALVHRAVALLQAERAPIAVQLTPVVVTAYMTMLCERAVDLVLHLGDAHDLEAVTTAEVGHAAWRELTLTPLQPMRITGVLMPSAHPLASRAQLVAEELSGYPQVALPRRQHPVAYEAKHAALHAHGWRPRAKVFEVESQDEFQRLASSHPVWAGVNRLVSAAPPGVVYRPLLHGGGSPWSLFAMTRREDAEAAGSFPTPDVGSVSTTIRAAAPSTPVSLMVEALRRAA